MMESSLQPPVSRDTISLADWIEATMFIEELDFLPKSVIRRRLKRNESDDDSDASLAMTEIRRRSNFGNSLYPFHVDLSGIERMPVPGRAYEFLLACSVDEFPFRLSKDWGQVVPTFERLATAALGSFYGDGTMSLRFGTPSEPDRPSRFPDALRWLAEKLQMSQGHLIPISDDNDGGVDAIAWRPFRDQRSGFPITLAQCTIRTTYQ